MARNRSTGRPGGRPGKAQPGRGTPRAQPKAQTRQPGRSGNPAVRSRAGSGAGRPLPPGGSFFTPGASPFRRRVERTSAPLVVLFHRLPRVVFGALPLILLVLGAFVPLLPLALVFLALALVLMVWLAYLSWPQTEGPQRIMRIVVPGLVVAIAVLRIARG